MFSSPSSPYSPYSPYSPQTGARLSLANKKMGIDPKSNKGLIFVYCPPKVGSTSLVSYLRIYLNHAYTIFHMHDDSTLRVLYKITGVTVNEIIQYNIFLGAQVYVIDVFREPIERKMSHYFEELESLHFNNKESSINQYDIAKITKRFNQVFPYIGVGDYYTDVYQKTGSETHLGLTIDKNATYIKLRLRDSKMWGSTLSRLFRSEVVVLPDHETTKKPLGELYTRFKAQYKIPRNLFELVVNDASLNKYVTEVERAEYIAKWSPLVSEEVNTFTESEYLLYKEISMENSIYRRVKLDHYLDEGCPCLSCDASRRVARVQIKNGRTNISSRIVHTNTPMKKRLQMNGYKWMVTNKHKYKYKYNRFYARLIVMALT